MQIIRGIYNLTPRHRYCVATIGNFDGVHLGHQAVFRQLRQKAAELSMPTTVIIFEPQPMEYFAPAKAPSRLTRLREKLQAIKDAEINRVVVLQFNRHLASMSANDFIRNLLLEGLDVRYLLVGDDFRFGQGRTGDIDSLRQAGETHNFEVDSMNTFQVGDERVSSTRIREALAAGDLQSAAHNLGRPYTICGRVAYGNQRGRTIGFPTINIELHRKVCPLRGVFTVMVGGLDDQPLPGIANIGNRPTLSGDPRYLLEVHLLDFNRNVYGSHVQVEFKHRLRDEERFDSFDALRQQIERDAVAARQYFSDGTINA